MRRPIRCLAALLVLSLFLCAAAPVHAAQDPLELARDAILQCYNTGAESADLSAYSLTPETLNDLFEDLYHGNALPWYAKNYSYTASQSTGKILTFTPSNLDEETYDRATYERTAAEILAKTVYPGMAQWQIALSIHDYLAVYSAYDESLTRYEGYDLLVNGTAVCNGYALAYMDLLRRAGVNCIYTASDQMDHGWNLIELDGKWYHLDLTWDDPTADIPGRVIHRYFLVSDQTISAGEKPHSGWNAAQSCTSTTYEEDPFWAASRSQICYESADVSYYHKVVDGTHAICRRDENTGNYDVLYSYDSSVTADLGDGKTITYTNETVGLSLLASRLYFCSGEQVFSMATDGTDLQIEYTSDLKNGHLILGCFATDGLLRICLQDDQERTYIQELTLEHSATHTHSYQETAEGGDCILPGKRIYTCSCGVSYSLPGPTPEGHDLVEETVRESTLFQKGLVRAVCSRCGQEQQWNTEAKLSLAWLLDGDMLPYLLIGGGVLVSILGGIFKKRK